MSITKARQILFTLYFGSGVSALIYEIIWIRMMGEVFGNSTYAISTVTAAFMGGLALGSWLGGKIIESKKNPLLYYLILEIGVGFSALVVSILMLNISAIYSLIYPIAQHSLILVTTTRFVLGFSLVLIPTALMGATLPTLSKFIMKRLNKIGGDFSVIYAMNTFGGLFGILLGTFYMFERIGVYSTLAFAISLNLIIGISVFMLFSGQNYLVARVGTSSGSKPVTESSNSINVLSSVRCRENIILLTGFITGFTAFAYEVLWARALVFYIGTSTYSFSLVLALILFGIAVGSILVRNLADRVRNPWNLVIIAQVLIAISAMFSIYLFSSAFYGSLLRPSYASWFSYLSQNLAKTSMVVFLPTLLMGISFPLLNKIYVDRIEYVGRRVGNLYAVNTTGSILGSLCAGFVLIPLFGISRSIGLTSLIILGLISFLAYRFFLETRTQNKKLLLIPSLAINVILLVVLLRSNFNLFTSYHERDIQSLLFYEEGVSATTKVYLDPNGFKKMTVNGQLMGGNFPKAVRKQMILADLPLLFRPDAKDIYVVGLGTGNTLVEFLSQKPDARIDCAEISGSVINGSRLFRWAEQNMLKTPNVNIITEDGKNYLKMTSKKYDIISSDTMLKKGGASNGIMYSKEYYDLCKEHLNQDGIFIQWVPLYLSQKVHRIILRTIIRSFRHTTLWYVGDEAMVHISSESPLNIDYERLGASFEQSHLFASLSHIGLTSPQSILSTFFMEEGRIGSMVGRGAINSISHPMVEFKSPRDLTSDPYRTVYGNLHRLHNHKQSVLEAEGVLKKGTISNSAKVLLNRFVGSYDTIVRALEYSYNRESKKATRELVKALLQNPDDSNVPHFLGISSFYPDDMTKARNYLQCGVILAEFQRDSMAVEMFEQSLDIEPDNLLTMNHLSLAYDRLGRMDSAIYLTKRMIGLEPTNFLFYFNLGYFYEQVGRPDDALEMYRKSLELNPGNEGASRAVQKLERQLINAR